MLSKEFNVHWCEERRAELVKLKIVCAICFDQKTETRERKTVYLHFRNSWTSVYCITSEFVTFSFVA